MSWDANHRRKESNKATDPLGLDRVYGVRFSLAGALWILSEIFFWLWSRTSADWMDCLLWWLTVGWVGTEGLGARLVLVGGGWWIGLSCFTEYGTKWSPEGRLVLSQGGDGGGMEVREFC
ncbi:hypothetical protein F9C07_2143685 [Aspergillus flavus]|uniref:Uncharacterized protein n=1 Tax=Aspergillus flavus (strain ATCC 200026 / FGSC A1120 / IAM 13836 / NRRL 3357 / JCM 12722 / SRRC 167) TaxID=332952 RepID=A0A7U2MWW9_ASPFN|nr:hypothetical protein F9C07_2143685 [Aspergillus flavus]